MLPDLCHCTLDYKSPSSISKQKKLNVLVIAIHSDAFGAISPSMNPQPWQLPHVADNPDIDYHQDSKSASESAMKRVSNMTRQVSTTNVHALPQ